MNVIFGNVSVQSQLPVIQGPVPRFAALVDVLGMSEWVRVVPPLAVAQGLSRAVTNAVTQSATGTVGSSAVGPLVGYQIFSDSTFLYTGTDTREAVDVLLGSLKMLVDLALDSGVPLRGVMAHGEILISRGHQIMVGNPLVELAR